MSSAHEAPGAHVVISCQEEAAFRNALFQSIYPYLIDDAGIKPINFGVSPVRCDVEDSPVSSQSIRGVRSPDIDPLRGSIESVGEKSYRRETACI